MAQAALSNGVSLEYEIHGDPSDPVILVILGITDNITDWPSGLYLPLVKAGFCVVRYELRDSGFSTRFDQSGDADLQQAKRVLEGGELPDAPYTAHDMAGDAVLLLQFLDIQSACVIGYSYGSLVAQILAIDYPSCVSRLVCLQGSNYNPELPGRTADVDKAMKAATLEYKSLEEQVDTMKNLRLATNGKRHALDNKEAMQSATTSVERMYYPQGTARIVLSRLATRPVYKQTKNVHCPTLILHGDQDPIFSIEHGKDMADRIPNSSLVILEGTGHNHPLSLQSIVVKRILDFLYDNPVPQQVGQG
jgi:pimeloyl-ACP methyl ester carboxylesterase